jgi:alpha-L-fucosidase
MNRHIARSAVTLVLIVACTILGYAQAGPPSTPAVPPRRPANFQPFRYEYTTEQLKEKFSEGQMKRAAAAWKEIQNVNDKGPWKPTWESINKHQAPEWFLDAKLGIMVNWGLHSVPAYGVFVWVGGPFYPDAYGCGPYGRGHLNQFYGADFKYDDFFPLFRAEHYDPDAWMELFQQAGARYVIPMSKHHDGVAWWDSAWTQRSFARMGPKRDLLTPLVEAARRRGIKTALYFCYEEYAAAMLDKSGQPVARIWDFGPVPSEKLDEANRRRISGSIPVSNYYDQYMMPLVKEMIDRFDPDGLWMDGAWMTPTKTLRSRELAAYFYNKSQGRKEVYVNDRYGSDALNKYGDVLLDEYRILNKPWLTHPWSECTTMSRSFAYNREETDQSFMPPVNLVHMFIDVISQNGNLELLIGPDSSGQIPQPAVDRLKALGAWIKANSEAVYGTRILPPYHEAVKVVLQFKDGDVCYMRSKDGKFAYAFCEQWPGSYLILKGVRAAKGATITMLGVAQPLTWQQDEAGLTINIPDVLQDEKARPCKYAWVVKIPMQLDHVTTPPIVTTELPLLGTFVPLSIPNRRTNTPPV